MSRHESIKNILKSLSSMNREFNTRGNYPFKHYNLGRPHIDILFLLSEQSPLSIKELSQRLNVTSGAVTQFVDALEHSDLVAKSDDPNDRRSRLIQMSSAAEGELLEFETEYIARAGCVFENLSTVELKQLSALLLKTRG